MKDDLKDTLVQALVLVVTVSVATAVLFTFLMALTRGFK